MKVKYKKPSKNLDRSFATISIMGAALKSVEDKDDYHSKLSIRINNMMKVYSSKVGKAHYSEVSNKVEDIWISLANEYKNTINEDSIIELVAAISHLIHPKVFKELLVLDHPPFGLSKDVSKEDYDKICDSVLRFNNRLDEVFVKKDIHIFLPARRKVKNKTLRKKVKSQAQKKHEIETKKHKERNDRVKSFLKNRVNANK